MSLAWGLFTAAVLPWANTLLLVRVFRAAGTTLFYVSWGCGGAGMAAGSALDRDWSGVAGGLLSAAVALVGWWWSRRRRDRARKLAGAKGRVVLAAMAARLREAGKPRPALKPIPGRA